VPYKVVRCAAPSELARDAGGKRAVGEAQAPAGGGAGVRRDRGGAAGGAELMVRSSTSRVPGTLPDPEMLHSQ